MNAEETEKMAAVWKENARLNAIRDEVKANNAKALWEEKEIGIHPRVQELRGLVAEKDKTAKKWLEYPNNMPEASGYYPTYYQNMKTNEFFYKAIAWHNFDWAPWNESIQIKVIAFIPSMRADYYTQIIPDESWFNYIPKGKLNEEIK